MQNSLKIIFAGTPDFAARHLDALLSSGHHIISVFTQSDRPAGRGNKIRSSPVKQLAKKHKLPIFQPKSLHFIEIQKLITNLQADIMVVVAYGLILPKEILNAPRFGCINVHGSLLPRWRGAAPIHRALLAGDKKTGITIIQMDEGLDTGNILLKLECPITITDTSATLCNKLSKLGSQGLLVTLALINQNNIKPQAQEEMLATYAKKINKEEAQINWSLSAIQLERSIRAFNPWPVSYFSIDNNLIKVWKAEALPHYCASSPGEVIAANKEGIKIATKEGILNIQMLQPSGKKIMSAQDILNSRRDWFLFKKRLS